MSQEEGSGGPDLSGLPVAEATDAVLAEDDSRDRDAVRATLETVAEDGVVSEGALESRLSEVAKVVSTPETRVEFAAMELSEARETAEEEGVSELDTVRTRTEGYESRLEAVEADVGRLGPRLSGIVGRREDGANAYEVAAALRELEAEANELHRAADELGVELEEFGRWLTDSGVRYDGVEEEIEAVERSLDALVGAADDLATGDGAASPEGGVEPAVVWADATLRTWVTALLVADLEAELGDLRVWPGADEEDEADEGLDELGERLDAVEERRRDLAGRLDELARPAWTERFGDRLDRVEDALDRFAPPVPWGEVEAELERYREEMGASG